MARRLVALAAAIAALLAAAPLWAVGESVNGFPNWAERVEHQWINRARVDPQLEMTACGANCVEKACYAVMPPLSWNLALNRAARFHSDELFQQSAFQHDSPCTLVSNISTLYPDSCNGHASCACVGGVKACSPTCTSTGARVQMFGASYGGEIIASPSDPDRAFYLWLYEPGDTANCTFTSKNGHRWLILKSTGAVGLGVNRLSTGDFGGGSAPTKIPSGSHYPRQATSVAAWANWYDTAGPSAASINVDGVCTPMTLQRGSQTNGAWSATVTGAGSGCHRYYFSFRDSGGTTVTYPSTGSLAIGSGVGCPDWDSARPAACDGAVETPTATPTVTATPTPVWSATRTPSATLTATRTASSTATPTLASAGADISGEVLYYSNDEPVAGVTMRAGVSLQTTTDSAGQYVLDNVPVSNVLVSAAGNGGAGRAISALDASHVLQSIANLRTLSAAQALACDVTGNGTLSTLDASQILQRTVGLIDHFAVADACDSDWAFIPVPQAAPGQTLIPPQVSSAGCTPGAIAYGLVPASLAEQNFAAVLFGDCTGNWQPPAAAGGLRALADTAAVRVGKWRRWSDGRVAVPVAITSIGAAAALEVRVTYDATGLRFGDAVAVGRTRRALLALNAEQAGEVRLALAAGTPLAPNGRASLILSFERVSGGALSTPRVSVRIDGD
jgi:hypothetical protein